MTKDKIIEQMREALERISDPLKWETEHLPKGYKLDGAGFMSLTANASYYQSIARAALAAAKAVEPETQYSIDTDPQGIRARVVSAVVGTLAYGARNTNKPPEGHWLNEVWDIARAEAKAVEPQPEREPLTDEQRIQNLADLTRWLDGLGSNIHTYSLRGIALAAWEAHSKAVEPQPEREPLTPDECQQIVELLDKEGHDGSDFEPECPLCTARQKLSHGITGGQQ